MAILKFYNHINIEIEILDPENLLLHIFHHFLCQLQIKTCKFIGVGCLPAILDFSGHVEFSMVI